MVKINPCLKSKHFFFRSEVLTIQIPLYSLQSFTSHLQCTMRHDILGYSPGHRYHSHNGRGCPPLHSAHCMSVCSPHRVSPCHILKKKSWLKCAIYYSVLLNVRPQWNERTYPVLIWDQNFPFIFRRKLISVSTVTF